MKRQGGGALLSTLKLDPKSAVPLYRQLEAGIRQMVLNGDLPANGRLPATRQLSLDLDVSRLTVKNAYEQLATEGFLKSRQGAGTFVADIAAIELPPETPAGPSIVSGGRPMLSRRADRIARSKATTRLGGVKAFRPGVPALDMFPRKAWAAAQSKVMRGVDEDLLGYGPPGGIDMLKKEIAIHVRDHRGILCRPEQIVVTSGAQQAFVLIALTLLQRDAVVWCEDPGHIAARDAMRLLGADIRSVPIDREGFDLETAVGRHPRANLVFTTPSHQHPLGVTMSLNRRLDLLDYAKRHVTWVVEDDYDSEFRYADRALPALQALDREGCVLYTGSFSKSLFPALRIGYLIAPPALVDALTAGQTLLSQNVSPVQQHILARFMADGSFNAHIRRMCNLYRKRRDLLIAALHKRASDHFELEPCRAGMHLIGWLKDRSREEKAVAEAIWNSGVDCLPVSIYCDRRQVRPGIMFGFACAREDNIDSNVVKVTQAVASKYVKTLK